MAHEHHHHDHDHHGHDHGHHHHAPRDFGVAFAIGIGLNFIFVVVEAVYGVLAHSMALLADAGHNLSDVLALALAWGASRLARREPSARFTYGLRSTSILAALVNAALLFLVTGGIAWESMQRLVEPEPVASKTVIWVALLGIVVNATSAVPFAKSGGDLNVRAAFLHLAADAAVSLGVVVAALVTLSTGWLWLDPVMGLAIALVIIVGTWGLLKDSVTLALNAVPAHIDPDKVRAYLATLSGVSEVHDLHIWAMSTTETALTVHLVMPKGHPGDAFTAEICKELRERHHVHHATVQIETGAQPCELAPDHVV
ncbi:MAG TPA: cation diffusion facilitator family transporter [Burkholderiales bacterium]|nr:cation diffusion facilitator family transporter [Burkholderiales bacterium]